MGFAGREASGRVGAVPLQRHRHVGIAGHFLFHQPGFFHVLVGHGGAHARAGAGVAGVETINYPHTEGIFDAGARLAEGGGRVGSRVRTHRKQHRRVVARHGAHQAARAVGEQQGRRAGGAGEIDAFLQLQVVAVERYRRFISVVVGEAGAHQHRAGQRARAVAAQVQGAIAAAVDALSRRGRIQVAHGAARVERAQGQGVVQVLDFQGGLVVQVDGAHDVVAGPHVQVAFLAAVAHHNFRVQPAHRPGRSQALGLLVFALHVVRAVVLREVERSRAGAIGVGAPAGVRVQLFAVVVARIIDVGLGRNHHVVDAQAVAVGGRVEIVAKAEHDFLTHSQVQAGEGGV